MHFTWSACMITQTAYLFLADDSTAETRLALWKRCKCTYPQNQTHNHSWRWREGVGVGEGGGGENEKILSPPCHLPFSLQVSTERCKCTYPQNQTHNHSWRWREGVGVGEGGGGEDEKILLPPCHLPFSLQVSIERCKCRCPENQTHNHS